MTLSRIPIFVKIGKGVLVWRWVEFWPFPLTCFVAFKTLALPCECVMHAGISIYTISAVQLYMYSNVLLYDVILWACAFETSDVRTPAMVCRRLYFCSS